MSESAVLSTPIPSIEISWIVYVIHKTKALQSKLDDDDRLRIPSFPLCERS